MHLENAKSKGKDRGHESADWKYQEWEGEYLMSLYDVRSRLIPLSVFISVGYSRVLVDRSGRYT